MTTATQQWHSNVPEPKLNLFVFVRSGNDRRYFSVCCRFLVITLCVHEMKKVENHCLENTILGLGLVSCWNFVPIAVSCTSLTAVLFQGSQSFY